MGDLLFGRNRRYKPTENQINAKLDYARQAAGQNDPRAQFALGLYFANPACPSRNLETAVKYYKESADQGHPDAEFAYAVCLMNGEGVRLNSAEAEQYLSRLRITATWKLNFCMEVDFGTAGIPKWIWRVGMLRWII
jgi:TPR repeat protein